MVGYRVGMLQGVEVHTRKCCDDTSFFTIKGALIGILGVRFRGVSQRSREVVHKSFIGLMW